MLIVVFFFVRVFCKHASVQPILSSISPFATLSLSLTHTSFAILLQNKLSTCAYVNLMLAYPLQRKLEG
jgi:hypothetical protein